MWDTYFQRPSFVLNLECILSVAYAIEHIFLNLCLESNFQKIKIKFFIEFPMTNFT
jgi:hypothetical protein